MFSLLVLRKILGFLLEQILELPRLISFKNKRTNCSLTFLQRQLARSICVYVPPHNVFQVDPISSGEVTLTVLIYHPTLTDEMVVGGGEIIFIWCWSLCRRRISVKVGWKYTRESVESVTGFNCNSLCSHLFRDISAEVYRSNHEAPFCSSFFASRYTITSGVYVVSQDEWRSEGGQSQISPKASLFPRKRRSEALSTPKNTKFTKEWPWITTHNYNILRRLILFAAIKIHVISTTQNKLLTSDARTLNRNCTSVGTAG